MITFNIKKLRALNHMSQQELIDKSGIRASTLSAYENSKAKTISIEHIDKLCELLHCQPADLMIYSQDNTSGVPYNEFSDYFQVLHSAESWYQSVIHQFPHESDRELKIYLKILKSELLTKQDLYEQLCEILHSEEERIASKTNQNY